MSQSPDTTLCDDDAATSHQQHPQQDLLDIALAHKYRLSLTSLPTQSSFRVVALVFYEGDSVASSTELPSPVADIRHDKRQYVVGTNDEPGGFIGGSICAERAALVQLRFLPHVKVTKIIIVTDYELPISPGLLCRQFMAGHSNVSWDVPLVLAGCKRQGEDGWTCTKTTLRQLFPHPSPYARLDASQAHALGKTFSEKHSTDYSKTSLPESVVRQLMAAARNASYKDDRSGLHPIQYGAAVLFQDVTLVSSHQKKALEYGATLDAVSQLVPLMERCISRPMALVQVDSHGVAHAPFAAARAFLSEHGFGDCRVLIHQYQQQDEIVVDSETGVACFGDLVDVLVSDLAPVAPDMGDLWSC